MNILIIVDYFYPSKGGIERLFENLVKNFANDHNIIVLTSRFDNTLPKKEKWNGVTIYRIGKNRFLFTLLGSIFGLKLIKNIDLIHTSTYNSAYIAKFLTFFKKIPVVITCHEILGSKWLKFKGKIKGFLFKKIEDLIYSFGFFYVFVSYHVRNVALAKYNIKNFTVIYNGVEKISYNLIDKKQLGFKKDDIIGVFAGRPGWPKGLDFLLKNFPQIKKLNPNFKLLLLLLEKNNYGKLKKLKKYLNKDIKILYEVPHPKVYDYLALADIGIVTSRSEGFGFSALEFSLLKKTTVLSFVGGIPEVNFGDCHFFKPDDVNQFLNAFAEIFNGKKNTYGYNKNLTVENMVKNYQLVYKKLLEIN